MIERILTPDAFEDWENRDIFSVRILALLKSYGCKYEFAKFFKQTVGGKITAIISKLDHDVTLSVMDGFDRNELVHFFCISGYASIVCSDSFDMNSNFDCGYIMSCNQKREASMQGIAIDEFPKLMDLYNFVDYDGQDFKAWYVDISHRVRHGTAKAYTLTVDSNIISSGILSSIIDGYAVLTAVRTADDFRRMGYGSTLVKHICSDVTGTVYIMRSKDLNEKFYTKIGFENIGIWRMYK